ncbi:hypothetical protein LJ737_14235 [Hymenobacter sp. 15J16-1T3B]|uniref:hypothetical protein n=1 Tax=Hymenobacter sp. 15J16-1T3B TaxID=2886941 RepID=UPI001D11B726|nr:hypothetical protein [Hymenobacter sp. 15J16-1T3B]MCC3158404.1 hypothetical protein [Hymenobacter sp. 15J16-1T3B]
MNSQWSYKYACSNLLQLLAGQAWLPEASGRLQERAQLVFRSLSPYHPTYLSQQLTDAHSLYFNAYLRTPLLAEVEVYSTPAVPDNPASVYLRLLEGGQYVLQQEMAPGEIAGRLALYYAAADPPR